jgi:hypothetical protein
VTRATVNKKGIIRSGANDGNSGIEEEISIAYNLLVVAKYTVP